jgi:hypothetical protein
MTHNDNIRRSRTFAVSGVLLSAAAAAAAAAGVRDSSLAAF